MALNFAGSMCNSVISLPGIELKFLQKCQEFRGHNKQLKGKNHLKPVSKCHGCHMIPKSPLLFSFPSRGEGGIKLCKSITNCLTFPWVHCSWGGWNKPIISTRAASPFGGLQLILLTPSSAAVEIAVWDLCLSQLSSSHPRARAAQNIQSASKKAVWKAPYSQHSVAALVLTDDSQ